MLQVPGMIRWAMQTSQQAKKEITATFAAAAMAVDVVITELG